MQRLIFTVTNDLSYDQRMDRICTSLASAGYEVLLIGRQLSRSVALEQKRYTQKRLRCFFTKGKLFYAEYNLRLFFFLLFQKADAVCAIDLDTILPCYFFSVIKNTKRVYDAHELFTELKEVKMQPFSEKIWKRIERFALPKFKNGYTVCDSIALYFKNKYGVHYETVRNIAKLKPLPDTQSSYSKKLIYSGMVNEGRCFEILIPAMKELPYQLIICGDGNFMQQAKFLAEKHHVTDKIIFKGMLSPQDLQNELEQAYIGINLVENVGLNQYYSLPNKFFDYIQTAIPQISMNYPEYQKINNEHHIALLILPEKNELIRAIKLLATDTVLYDEIKKNCLTARVVFNWENEEQKLLQFYHSLFKVE